jgi:hypothetical protein
MTVDQVRSALRERVSRRPARRFSRRDRPRRERPRQVDGVRSALAGLRRPGRRADANSGNNG